MRTYDLHGLRIGTDLALSARESRGQPEFEILRGADMPIPDAPPAGEVLADASEVGLAQWVVRTADGISMGFGGRCSFTFSDDSSPARWHLDPSSDAAIAAILAESSVLARLLALRGTLVLHASAVSLGGCAVAFCGHAGSGKSTLATWLVRDADAEMVTDDALVVDVDQSPATCFRGTTVGRLRPSAKTLAASFPHAKSADGRTDVQLEAKARQASLPLSAVAICQPDREIAEPAVIALDHHDAVAELVRFPRSIGWVAQDPVIAHFDAVSRLSAAMPVVRLRVPWGPPFEAATAERVGASLRALIGA